LKISTRVSRFGAVPKADVQNSLRQAAFAENEKILVRSPGFEPETATLGDISRNSLFFLFLKFKGFVSVFDV
jgi:hypothetical protein